MSVPPLVVVVLSGVLTVAALGGCGGDESDQPRPLPPFTASPSSPSATTSTTPSTPADLERSAEDFVRAYFREVERANRSADPAQLRRDFYHDACQPCMKDVSVLEEDQKKGQHVEGYGVVLVKLDPAELKGDTLVVDLIIHHRAGRVVRDKDQAVLEQLRATKPVQSVLELVRKDNDWRIVDITSLGVVEP